ncbi:MAG: hypothetical protein KJN89_07095 [Gammaproteobacteria bacterium]|nr:hypothetical protein [Gammaproteobacteria bacterium]NNJ50128.1 hypothetical protein [Gammaproteobacteria bacterium]
MNNYLTLSASALLLSAQLLTTGCSSDDGDGGGTATVPATVPANATVIDASNAETLVATVSTSLSSLDQALAVEATPVIGINTALDIILPRIKNSSKDSGIDLATGVAFNDSGACAVDGTYSFTGDESDDGVIYSETVTATFVACDDGLGFVIGGTLSGTFTENNSTGDYTDNFSGSLDLTIVSGSDTITVSFTGLDFSETGNNFESTYTTTKSTFALVITVNGANQYGFLAELSAPIVESSGGESSCPESGTIKITGGNGTTAEGIYNSDGTMTINANGSFVTTATTCYS